MQELTVELINLPSSTKDYHCETRLVWDLPCRHELGSVMIDGTIEMESIPKRRWWVDEVKGNSLSNQVVDVLNPKHYMKYVVALGRAFEKCHDDSDKTYALEDGITKLLGASFLPRHTRFIRTIMLKNASHLSVIIKTNI